MAAITAAAIGAGAGILGDVISHSGQAEANKQNMALQMQNEQWQEKMSDTAVQRRKADLLAAGFNPLLATGQAASQPSVSQAVMQNPDQAFANLGPQVSSALQTASNIKVQDAQAEAAKSQAELNKAHTPGDDILPLNADGTIDWQHAPHGGILGNLEAANLDRDQQQKLATINKINADIKNVGTQTDLNTATTMLKQLDFKTQAALYDSVVKAQNALNQAAAAGAGASAKVMGSGAGVWIEALDRILGHGSGGGTIYRSATQ